MRRTRRGHVTGYVLKLARESIPASQEHLAEALAVDRATIQGWETGRRPFTSTRAGDTIKVRHRLARLGADRRILASLNDAMEADHLLAELIDQPHHGPVDDHPLAFDVLTRSVVSLMNWAVSDTPPHGIAIPGRARHGAVADRPSLDAAERAAYLNGLRSLAERSANQADDSAVLAHRQACYQLAAAGHSNGTLRTAQSAAYFTRALPWSPRWADARTIAVSTAVQGDPQPLADFLAVGFADDTHERANLNYWAFWVGEVAERQHSDHFQTAHDLPWRGTLLLRQLVDGLRADNPYVALTVHTIWALLPARRGLIHDDPAVARTLAKRGRELLDQHTALPAQARRELEQVLYRLPAEGVHE